jgi:AcrR family transcriptional regulator
MANARDPASTRERIVLAGHAAMRRVGIRRLTMEDLARRAGVSRAQLYRYFPDKQTLVDAVLAYNGHLVREELTNVLADAPTFAEQCVRAALFSIDRPGDTALLDLHETEPEALALMLTTGARPFLERATRFWEPYVRAAQATGDVRDDLDPLQTAEWVARFLYALAVTPSVTFDRDDPGQLDAHVRTFLVAGLAPDRKAAVGRPARAAASRRASA